MQKSKSSLSLTVRLRAALFLLIALGLITGGVVVHADSFDDQINALAAQNNSARGVLSGLESQAASYQEVINQLAAQIAAVQAQLNANLAQQADLEQKIAANKAEIADKKLQLSADVQAMYIDGQMSSIEQLASSNNLSEYIDKEEYRTIVQNQLNEKIKVIADLQAQLEKQKVELDTLIVSEKAQNDLLAATQAEQNSLLAYNQSQQAEFNNQIAANSSKIGELRRQQAIENSRYNIGNFKGDPNNGGYPNVWAYAGQDTMVDSWGMYNRECVSYTAFRVHQDFLAGRNSRDMPYWGGIGNANQWDDNARASGIQVDSNPTPGSIAISNAGFYGHAMYVEAVNGNEVYVQQYNQQLTGQYSEGWRYTTGLVFLHF